jgi:hypothetical protein
VPSCLYVCTRMYTRVRVHACVYVAPSLPLLAVRTTPPSLPSQKQATFWLSHDAAAPTPRTPCTRGRVGSSSGAAGERHGGREGYRHGVGGAELDE